MLDSVTVWFPTMAEKFLGPVIFKELNTDQMYILESSIAGLSFNDVINIDLEPISRFMLIGLQSNSLPVGEYEVIPYILIRREPIPVGLLESLGENVEALGPDYLKIPILREVSPFVPRK